MPKEQVGQINSFIERHLLRSSLRVESLVWLLFIGVLLYILRSILFKGNEIFAHDTLYWYPLYQFFAENIIQGRFPYWNPYTHGGEPFFPAIHAGTRLLDPTTFIVILLGKIFKVNLLILFAWDLVVKCILSAIGTYILLRRWAEHRISQLSLIPILLFSSFTFISFRQNGLLFNFMWTPFIVYFLFEIIFFKKNSWSNWLGMVLFIGISAQSYHFTGVCIFLLFLGVGLILFNRELLIDTYQTKKVFLKVGASLIVIMLLWLPVFAAYLEKDKLFSPARFSRSPLYEFSLNDPEARKKFHESARKFNYQLSYQEIEDSGSTSSVANFIQFINPYGYYWWIEYGASEASIYVGMLVFLIGLIGIIGGRNPLKKAWLLVLICSALFILGPNGVLHRLLYYIYPPVQLARHTHNFTTYFILSFLFFYIIGCNIILNKIPNLPIYLKFSDILPDCWWRWRWLNYLEGILFSFWIMLCFNHFIEKMYNSPYDVSQRITRWAIRFLIMGCAGLFFLAINTVWNKKLKLITTYFNKYDTYTMILSTTLFSYVILILIEYNRFYYLYYPQTSIHQLLYYIIFVLMVITIILLASRYINKLINIYSIFISMVLVSILYPFINNYIRNTTYITNITNGLIYHHGALSINYYHGAMSIIFIIFFVITPIIIYSYNKYNYYKYNSIILIIILFIIVLDLLTFVYINKKYAWGVNNYITFNTNMEIPSFPKTRELYPIEIIPPSLERSSAGHSVRYISLAFRKTYMYEAIGVKGHAWWRDYHQSNHINIKQDNYIEMWKLPKWATLVTLQNYARLLYSNINMQIQKEMFSIDRPLLQFKYGYISTTDDVVEQILNIFTIDQAILYLDNNIFIYDKKDNNNSKGLIQKENVISELRNYNTYTYNRGTKDLQYMIVNYNSNLLEAEINVREDGILYYADGYDEHWHAYLDKREIPIYRANLNFKAVFVPQGNHRICFEYDPWLYRYSLYIYFGTFLIIGLWMVLLSAKNY